MPDVPELPQLPDGYALVPLRVDHAAGLAAAYDRNRDHLAPWDPARAAEFYTEAGQRAAVGAQLVAANNGFSAMFVLEHEGQVAGRLNFNTIVRGVMQGATLGYWVDAGHTGRGLATTMTAWACATGLRMGLHRIEASTMPHNLASQRVLEKCGFVQFGRAPEFLFLAGKWQDSLLFQRILHTDPL